MSFGIGPGGNPNCHYGDHDLSNGKCSSCGAVVPSCARCGVAMGDHGGDWAASQPSLDCPGWLSHEDAVEALLAVCSEALRGYWQSDPDATINNEVAELLTTVLAPENRETVLAALGMEQVGWANVSVDQEYLGIWRDTADVEAEWEPVYVYRGNR